MSADQSRAAGNVPIFLEISDSISHRRLMSWHFWTCRERPNITYMTSPAHSWPDEPETSLHLPEYNPTHTFLHTYHTGTRDPALPFEVHTPSHMINLEPHPTPPVHHITGYTLLHTWRTWNPTSPVQLQPNTHTFFHLYHIWGTRNPASSVRVQPNTHLPPHISHMRNLEPRSTCPGTTQHTPFSTYITHEEP